MAPVLRKSLEHDLDTRLGADKSIGAGADRMLGKAGVADLFDIALWQDETDRTSGAAVKGHEIGPDFLHVKADYARVDNFDLRHFFFDLGSAGSFVAVIAELDVLGGQRIAVVKGQPWAQFECVGEAVLAFLPGFGEGRAHLLSGVGAHQRIVQCIEDAKRRNLRRRQ